MELYPKRARRGGRKNRKHGRAGRKPSHVRYNLEKRWEANKARRIAKEKRRQARLKARKEAKEEDRYASANSTHRGNE